MSPQISDAYVARAVELIQPPSSSVRLFRKQFEACVQCARRVHRVAEGMPAAGEMEERARNYLKALRLV